MGRPVYKPYTKFIELGTDSAGNASSIDLRDSGGQLLNCNYILVQASSPAYGLYKEEGGLFIVELVCNHNQSAYLSGIAPTSHTVSGDVAAYGFIGGAANSRNGVVEIVLSPLDSVNTILLRHFGPAAYKCRYFITYGVIYEANEQRARQSGGVGNILRGN